MQTIKKLIPLGMLAMPLMALAATQTWQELVIKVQDALEAIIPLLLVIATVVFLVGVVRYITAGGDEEKLTTGRNTMIWGIVGLAVMLSVWGLAKIIVTTLGTGGESIPTDID